MKRPVLVIIKPDALQKKITGHVFERLSQTGLQMVALKLIEPTKKQVQEHYNHLRAQPFYNRLVELLLGRFHKEKKLIFIIYYGKNAIKICREIAGATNPEEADPTSLRGAYGRITAQGIYENVVHVSSDPAEAEREIKLWFQPKEILINCYPTKLIQRRLHRERIWA